jgi:hypothetical protein
LILKEKQSISSLCFPSVVKWVVKFSGRSLPFPRSLSRFDRGMHDGRSHGHREHQKVDPDAMLLDQLLDRGARPVIGG